MGLSDLTDEELMIMYQNGIEDAFQILYDRHSRKIFGFLRGRVWNDEKASELFQETFLKIHRSKHLYNKSLPALPWIFSVTRSVLIDGLRKQKRSDRDQSFFEKITPLNHEEHRMSDVAPYMKQLSKDQQTAIQLRYVDEKTFEEIAAALKTSPSNVRKIVSRAVSKLKATAIKGGKP